MYEAVLRAGWICEPSYDRHGGFLEFDD